MYSWISIVLVFLLLFSCERQTSNDNLPVDKTPPGVYSEQEFEIDTIKFRRPVRYGLLGPIIGTEYCTALQSMDQNSIDTNHVLRNIILDMGGEILRHDEVTLVIQDFVLTDFENDGVDEMVLFFRESHIPVYGFLFVFKRTPHGWENIFRQEFSDHYAGVELRIESLANEEKILYINQLEQRGSGIRKAAIYFYRLIGNSFVEVLRILESGHIHGWGLYLNQEWICEFWVNTQANSIHAKYDFRFFSGAILDPDAPWESHLDLPFVAGELAVVYEWNEQQLRYETLDANAATHLALFDKFGNDSLFLSMYREELEVWTSSSDSLKVEIASRYLAAYDSTQQAGVSLGEIIKTTESGDLEFFRVEEK